jgi:hypothetical protein
MKRLKTLNDLISSIPEIKLDDCFSFADDHFNQWLLKVEEDWIAVDDSIREEDLTDDDIEFYPRSTLSIIDSYVSFTSSGESIRDSILSVLYEGDLIDESTFNKLQCTSIECVVSHE